MWWLESEHGPTLDNRTWTQHCVKKKLIWYYYFCQKVEKNIIKIKLSLHSKKSLFSFPSFIFDASFRRRLACTRDLGLPWCTSLFNGWIMIVHKFYHVLHTHEHSYFNFSFSLTVPFCPSSLPDFVTVKWHKMISLIQ
jgi:hypothetical protein